MIGRNFNISDTSKNLGLVYSDKGDFPKAMELFKRSLEIINIYDLKTQKSYLLRNIASTLSKQGNHDKALKNDFKAVEIAKEFDNQPQVALLYNDIALEYKIQKKYQKAIEYFDLSSQLFRQLDQITNADAVEGNKKFMIDTMNN